MKKTLKKTLAGALALAVTLTSWGQYKGQSLAADTQEGGVSSYIKKSNYSNPVAGFDADGNMVYGGDPSVLVDGDTVYLYVGHDKSTDQQVGQKIYNMDGWICYSTKDLKDWKYEGYIMKENKDTISWASSNSSAWAAQMTKHYDKTAKKDKYYFYYCTWDATSQGKQSIGVAVSDSPTGPFVDSGSPLVKGTDTSPQSSNWDDIDPTVWIETDKSGVEHRYLAWGNSRLYVCELEEDMVSIKDLNGDGKITCGSDKSKADILLRSNGLGFTEAPWIYRRQDAKGNYTGDYYLFYASGWRERMAYATTDDLLSGDWSKMQIIMRPTATSNTNHMAVFDFKGKTYFVHHNGALPAGNGYRRSPCILELKFNEDGSIDEFQESTSGLNGSTSVFYTNSGAKLGHTYFVNSTSDGEYPYNSIKVGAGYGKNQEDREWVLTAGKANKSQENYISIQSENKTGLYLTANSKSSVTLSQDSKGTKDFAKRQTFKYVAGLANEKEAISLESVKYPGYYLTIVNKVLTLTKGGDK
ncbi:MAG: family 43 glycosylhydrolase, partial [Eubacterium sp.]|nr:family 43 glycosylhydrolase [Eubacterium sp.]